MTARETVVGRRRRWRTLLVALGVVLAVLALLSWLFVRRQLPDLQAPPLPGLSAQVRISFDRRGIPTVRAANLLDALRAQGYLHARERMFQMELSRRAAEGRLA